MFSISNQRKHTNLNHLCFQNTVYKLDVSGYHGNGGDSLSYSNGAKFTTYDRDHDTGTKNCASLNGQAGGGAWWWKNCGYSNLNGFNHGHARDTHKTMNWYHFGSSWKTLKTASMAIRPIRL